MSPNTASGPDREDRLGAILVAWLEPAEAGLPPDEEQWLARYPEFSSELREFFASQHEVLAVAAPLREIVQAGPATPSPELTTGAGGQDKAEPSYPRLASRLFGDYEVREEIGRGGMSVVYRAWQISLNRPVALKVLRHAHGEAQAALRRFRHEAELIALLDHPAVVPIHEVGEHAGQVYFAMKLVEGGNLADRLEDFKGKPRAGAQLLARVARAVEHAHKRGVLHRDLKPSNILLDREGQPYVADFGLGKRLEGDSEITQSGSIVGTPSYMAPEQTTGKRRPATTATDTYGLGSILYVLLTGRPPFHSESVLDTLLKVRESAVEPPSKTNPQIDRDLETICLKCLDKAPARRYPTAAELADDIERYLAGQPIMARPVRIWERTWKWARRQPLLATLAAVCVLCLGVLVAGAVRYEARLRLALTKAQAEGERADGNYRSAREALRKILQRTSDQRWKQLPRLEQLRRLQAEDALAFFDAIAEQQADGPDVRQDVAYACLEAGKLQLILGQNDRALKLLRRADRLSETALSEAPDDLEIALLRADALHSLGMATVVAAAKIDAEATLLVEQETELLETLIKKHPASPIARQRLASACLTLGGWHQHADKLDRAESCLLRSVELCNSLLRERPGERETQVVRAGARVNLAALCRSLKKAAERSRYHREAEADLEQAVAADLTDPHAISSLAVLRINGAYDLAGAGKHEEALAYVTRNVAMLEAALKREPDHINFRDGLRRTQGVRATMLDGLNRYPECVKAWEQMMALSSQTTVADARGTLVLLLRRAGDLTRAIAETDVMRKEATGSTSADRWKLIADHYAGLADDVGKDARLSPEQLRQLQDRLRAAGREAAEHLAKTRK